MITVEGLEKLKKLEGLRLVAYQDQANIWTVGYGHTGKDVTKDTRVTVEEAEALLLADTLKAEKSLSKLPPLPPRKRSALIMFIYNIGVAAFKGSTMYKLLEANAPDEEIVAQFYRWNKVTVNGKKVVSEGLTNRRIAEASMYRS